MAIDIEYIIPPLIFAQENQPIPPVPGEASQPIGTTESGTAAPGGGAAPSLFGSEFFVILLFFLLVMVFLSMMGQRRERKKREAMLSAIKKHDRVQTVGGVIGSVIEIKPDHVVLKVDESSNTRITFSRSAVQQVLTSGPEPVSAKLEPEA